MNTKEQIARTKAAVETAQGELEAAQRAHRKAFCEALVKLMNEYGLKLESLYSGLEVVEATRPVELEDLEICCE